MKSRFISRENLGSVRVRMLPCSIPRVNPYNRRINAAPGRNPMSRRLAALSAVLLAIAALQAAAAQWPDRANGVNWSTAGTASTPHFVAEMLKGVGVTNLNIVPYRSGNEGVTAVIANNVAATSEASIVVLPQIMAGKLRAIATTYETRITAAPEIKTTKEAGYPAVTISHWAGLFAPKGTPQPILERMNAELLAVVKSKDFQEKLVPQGIEPAPYSLSGYVA